MEPMYGPEVNPAFGFCFIAAFAVLGLALMVVSILIYCKIFSKAGYHWAMGLMMLIPLGNLILLLILAFGQWPVLRELDALRRGAQPAPPTAPQSFRNV